MLKPAQLYKEKLQEENIKSWYKPENIFWNSGTGDSQINIKEDNYDCHQFVSVDKEDNVIGYITYAVDWSAMSADKFGIISFRKGSIEFAKDVYKAICNLFEIYHMNRISWFAYVDNPAIKGYRSFVKRHGGRECAYHRQIARLQDGKLHDAVNFEILAEEFHRESSKQDCTVIKFCGYCKYYQPDKNTYICTNKESKNFNISATPFQRCSYFFRDKKYMEDGQMR